MISPAQSAAPPAQKPPRSPTFTKAEGEAMLTLAQTLKAVFESPSYQSATNPSWWKRNFS